MDPSEAKATIGPLPSQPLTIETWLGAVIHGRVIAVDVDSYHEFIYVDRESNKVRYQDIKSIVPSI